MKKFLLGFVLFLLTGCQGGKIFGSIKEGTVDLSEEVVEMVIIEKPTEVVFMSPSNSMKNVKGKVPLNFLWKDPIFPLQNHQGAKKFLEKHVSIKPEQKGVWKILGTTGVSFEPQENWQNSTEYKLVFSPDLVPDFEYKFETPRLEIEKVETHNLVKKDSLKLDFNQDIDIEKIAGSIKLSHQKTVLLFDLEYGTEEYKDKKNEILKNVLELTPRKNWLEGNAYEIEVAVGSFSLQGDLPIEKPLTQKFQTAPSFSITNFATPKHNNGSVNIQFSAEVSTKDFVKYLEMTPALPVEAWEKYTDHWVKGEYDSRYFHLNPPGGSWDPREEFTINIKPGLEDQYGRLLENPQEKKFTTVLSDHFNPVFMPKNHSTFSNDVTLQPSFVYGGNVDEVIVKLDDEIKIYKLDSSLQERKIWTIDIKKEFPFIVDNLGNLKAGKYNLSIEVAIPGRRWRPSYESEFFVSDFSVEIKKSANSKFQIYAQAFPGDTQIGTSFDMETFVGNWEKEWHYKTFENVVNGFGFEVEKDQLKTVVIRQGSKIGYGSTHFDQGIRPWDAHVEYNSWRYNDKFSGVMFTDRPLYKPGQKVYIKGFIRDLQLFGKNFPLKTVNNETDNAYKIRVYDGAYNEIETLTGNIKGGSFDEVFEIPDSAKLGGYNLNFELIETTGSSFSVSAPFWIQEYRKPNFLIYTNFDAEKALLQEVVTAKVKAQYAFGGAIANRPIDYTVSLFGSDPCRFWCWGYQSKKDKVITSGNAILDINGEFEIPIELKNLELEETNWNLLTVNATISVSEAETSSTEKSIPFFVSNRTLKLTEAPYFFKADEVSKIKGEVRNLNKKLLEKEFVEMTFFKTKWVRNDRKNPDGNFYGEWESADEKLWNKSVKTNSNGQFEFEFKTPKEGGEYFFVFSTEDENGRVIKQKKNFWISGSDMKQMRQNDTNKILSLFPNKDEYKVGETVNVFAPNPEFTITRAHATLERGEVLEELEFNFEDNTVSFEAEDWMAPNIFISILLEGKDETGNLKVKWGSSRIPVLDLSHALDVSITPEKLTYRPGEEAIFKIKTTIQESGVEAEVAIAVVDQTLLALKSRVEVDLMTSLIGDWPLGVSVYHTLANFMSEAEMQEILAEADGVMARMSAKFGGGGGGKGDDFKPRGDFRDTAEFMAKVETDENGEATVSFKLPDNLTTWNIFGAGATTNNAFGTAESDFKVTLPLLISEIVPNFFQSGDVINIGLLVHRDNTDEVKEKIKVTLKLPPELEAVTTSEKEVFMGKEAKVYFPVRVKNTYEEKTISFGFEVEAEDSDLKDAIVLERKIVPPIQTLSAAEFLRVTEGTKFSILPDKNALTSDFEIKVFASLANYLEKLVEVARKVNYGCAEQRFSFSTAQMYQAQLDTLLGRALSLDKKLIEENRKYIEKSFFAEGGFGYWEDSKRPSFWVTSQILEHATLWQKFEVPFSQEKLEKSADWLRQEMLRTCDGGTWYCPHDISRLNAAYTLTKYGQLSVNDLEFLNKFTSSVEAKIWWMRASQNVGEISPELQKIYDGHLESIQQSFVIRDRYGFWKETGRSFYSQDERLTAIALETLMEKETFPEQYHKVALYLAESKKEFLSGNSSMRILKALAQYTETQEKESIGANFLVENKTGNEVLIKGALESLSQVQKFEKLDISKDQQEIVVKTDKPILVEVEMKDTMPSKFVTANARGFWIDREVFAMDGKEEKGEPVHDLELGETYLVKLRIVTNNSHRQVLVEDPIISGSEIVNFDLDNSDKALEKVMEGGAQCVWGWCRPLVDHKEYRYDKARFFIEHLPAGTHEISYILRTRLPGQFEWLPARVEEMYYPEIFANTAGKNVEIKGE